MTVSSDDGGPTYPLDRCSNCGHSVYAWACTANHAMLRAELQKWKRERLNRFVSDGITTEPGEGVNE